MIKKFFELRGELDKETVTIIEISGVVLLLCIWEIITLLHLISPSLLPPPMRVITAFKELHFQDLLVRNLGYSVKLNLLGYVEAILIALPVGFVIGLFP